MEFESDLGVGAADLGDDRGTQLPLPVVDDPQRAFEDEPAGVRVGGPPLPLCAFGGTVAWSISSTVATVMEASFSPS